MQQFCKHNIKTGVVVQIQYVFGGWSYWIVLEISKTSNFYGCDNSRILYICLPYSCLIEIFVSILFLQIAQWLRHYNEAAGWWPILSPGMTLLMGDIYWHPGELLRQTQQRCLPSRDKWQYASNPGEEQMDLAIIHPTQWPDQSIFDSERIKTVCWYVPLTLNSYVDHGMINIWRYFMGIRG